MRVRIDPTDARPIWSQLEDQFRRLIGSGALGAGAAVPSVRDMARELVVNPATVSKAYRVLTDAGLLVVRRGQGTFVAEEAPRFTDAEMSEQLHDAADRYVVAAKSLQVPLEGASRALESSWNGLDGASGAADVKDGEE